MSEIQIAVFTLNGELCGADSSQVKQIIKYQEVAKIPKMPKFLDGIINWRGNVVPIVSLNKRFELGETEINKKTKIILTTLNGKYVGFTVNDVVELLKLADEDIEIVPDIVQKAGNSYVKSVGKKGDKLVSIIDLDKVLADNEIKKIEKLKTE